MAKAKRFRDTGRWRGWYRELPPKIKLLWDYLCDECDHAGIFKEDYALASFCIGEAVTWEDVKTFLASKIVRIDSDKLFIPSFIEFQYGLCEEVRLNPENNAHKGVIKELRKNGIDPDSLAPSKPLPSPSYGAHEDLARSTGKGKGEGIGTEEGGMGGVYAPRLGLLERRPKVTSEVVAECQAEWQRTLEHFEINRPLGERDQIEIARAVQTFGGEWVKLALQGARKQKAGPRFDPKQFVSLRIYLDKTRIERLVNIGAGKESSDGLDWSNFMKGGAA